MNEIDIIFEHLILQLASITKTNLPIMAHCQGRLQKEKAI